MVEVAELPKVAKRPKVYGAVPQSFDSPAKKWAWYRKSVAKAGALPPRWKKLYKRLFPEVYARYEKIPGFGVLELIAVERMCYLYSQQKWFEEMSLADRARLVCGSEMGYGETVKGFRFELNRIMHILEGPVASKSLEGKKAWARVEEGMASIIELVMKVLSEEIPDKMSRQQIVSALIKELQTWKERQKVMVKETFGVEEV